MVSYEGLKAMGVAGSPRYIRQLIRMGRFPKPVSGGRAERKAFEWRESDVKAYLKSKSKTR